MPGLPQSVADGRERRGDRGLRTNAAAALAHSVEESEYWLGFSINFFLHEELQK